MAEADPHALEALYDRHVRSLYGLALRILQDPGEAQGVVRAVFSDAWSLMRRPDGGGAREPPAPRLAAATRRRAIERLRARSAPVQDDLEVVDLPRPALADERPGLPADTIPRLRAALADLPVVERTAIESAALEGMTAARIADRLELPLETVRDHIRTGLRTLRETLTA